MSHPFDDFLAAMQSAPPAAQTKSAVDVAAENAFWDAMTKQAMLDENAATRDLFNAAFEDESAKIASQDPWYAEVLTYLAQKAAFEEGYTQEKSQGKAA